ncbi:SatD family protein [Alkalibaculum bacchi]|uniref:SatD family protein n=2 Tax=Alkalibaculum bacchi TaxID=645887 RepID=A0A366IAM5_9FIRM|nr:SatD family protein [Alkalibaculum bacchi]RBP66787.1 SatD family protein [Alkalibaculum bacchi]
MITLGDEFQGLLNYGEDVMNIISDIELEMFPIRIRFGVGIGTLTTEVNREIPLGADGPAYYNARKMIDELKKIERMNRKSDSNIMIASEKNHDNDMMLNAILSLCFTLQSKWTKRQRDKEK